MEFKMRVNAIQFVLLASLALGPVSASAGSMAFNARSALVIDEASGEVLAEKNPDAIVPIASLTKLMTAMVFLDSKPNLGDRIKITGEDVDTLKHSHSRVAIGSVLSKGDVLQLALMSSDNRAAAALARTFPGGEAAFVAAVRSKIQSLGLRSTTIAEPTGLSPDNRSTASDLSKIAVAAARYPRISQITTEESDDIAMNGHEVKYRNTNKFVGKKGWPILLSKTGFTNEAGRCVVMRLGRAGARAAGGNVVMVLLGAGSSAARASDALAVRRLLAKTGPSDTKMQAEGEVKKRRKPARLVRVAKADDAVQAKASAGRRGA